MNIIKKFDINNKFYLVPILAIISLLTWVLDIPEITNIVLYSIIFFILVGFKASNMTLVIFLLFSMGANQTPSFLSNKYPFTFLYQAMFILYGITSLTKLALKRKPLKGSLLKHMMFICIYSILTLIWTVNKSGGFSEILIFIQGYIVYLTIRNDDDSKCSFNELSWLFSILLLTIAIQYQILIYNERIIGLGYKPFSVDHFFFTSKDFFYYYWTNGNLLAALVGIMFFPSLYKYFSPNKSKYTFLYLPIEILIIYTIYATKSEGLYLSFIVSLGLLPVVLLVKDYKKVYTVLMSGLGVFILLMLVVVLLKNSHRDFYNKVNQLSNSRIGIYTVGFNQLQNPLVLLFGKGLGSTRTILLNNGHNNYYFHTWILNTVVQRGLVTLGLIVTLILTCFKTIYKDTTKFHLFVSLAFITYLSHSAIDIGFEYQYIGVILYLMVAVIEKKNDKITIIT